MANNRNIPQEVVYLVLVIFVMFLSLIGLSDLLTGPLSAVFSPYLSIASQVGGSINTAYSSIGQINMIRNERNDLLVENAILRSQNSIVIKMQDELQLLKKETEVITNDVKIVEAEVLSNKDEEVAQFLILNVGTDKGISEGDIARVGNIYIGYIDNSDRGRSRVKLPTQGDSTLEVIIIPREEGLENLTMDQISSLVSNKETSIWKGVAIGGSSGIVIENIEKNASINDGDHILINDQDIGRLLYLGDIGDINRSPSDIGITSSVILPINYRNLLNLIVELDE